jgi:enamine deaminase RidA (YjgF/YER057c/UK114 family)
MSDIVANRVYLTDVNAFGEMNKAYVPNFPKNPPARATVKTGLVGSEGLVEIMFVAAK